jgi:hypothetical protein
LGPILDAFEPSYGFHLKARSSSDGRTKAVQNQKSPFFSNFARPTSPQGATQTTWDTSSIESSTIRAIKRPQSAPFLLKIQHFWSKKNQTAETQNTTRCMGRVLFGSKSLYNIIKE